MHLDFQLFIRLGTLEFIITTAAESSRFVDWWLVSLLQVSVTDGAKRALASRASNIALGWALVVQMSVTDTRRAWTCNRTRDASPSTHWHGVLHLTEWHFYSKLLVQACIYVDSLRSGDL